MRKLLIILGVAGVGLFLNQNVVCAQQQKVSSPSRAVTPYEDLNAKAEKQTQEATKDLGLNDEQKSKFKKLAMERLYRIGPINEKIQSSTDESEIEKLKIQKKQINDEYIKKVNEFLTPNQQELFKKKLDEIKQQRREF